MTLLLAARELWVEIEGAQIVAVGTGEPPRADAERVAGLLAPGLCDLQVNGAGGRELAEGAAAVPTVDALLAAHGVTSYLAALPSPDDATARRVLPELAEYAADSASPLAGVHLEGPFLSPRYAGMHPESRLRSPADGVPDWLFAPPVRLVTLAPELPGALDLIARLRAHGIAVALGHSGADAATATAAIEAGATLVTHVFNAMAPLDHRAPGLAGVALVDVRVHVSVIADGVHIDPLVLELIRRAAGDRVVLVSDSTPAAGAPPGRYRMAGVEIDAEPGVGGARTTEGRLAGSTATLDETARVWTRCTEATLAESLRAAGEVPAALVGLPSGVAPGNPADLVVLGDDGAVRRVMRRGRWLSREDVDRPREHERDSHQ